MEIIWSICNFLFGKYNYASYCIQYISFGILQYDYPYSKSYLEHGNDMLDMSPSVLSGFGPPPIFFKMFPPPLKFDPGKKMFKTSPLKFAPALGKFYNTPAQICSRLQCPRCTLCMTYTPAA